MPRRSTLTASLPRSAAKYTYGRPFTKESLLYREIFEKYYPGQAEMIVDYWMPNKAWPHCDVNDPSARECWQTMGRAGSKIPKAQRKKKLPLAFPQNPCIIKNDIAE